MSAKQDNINERFREALAHHEMEVSPKVWESVSAGIQSTAAVSTVSLGTILGKVGAVLGAAAVITGATVSEVTHWSTNENDNPATELVIEKDNLLTKEKTEQDIVKASQADATEQEPETVVTNATSSEASRQSSSLAEEAATNIEERTENTIVAEPIEEVSNATTTQTEPNYSTSETSGTTVEQNSSPEIVENASSENTPSPAPSVQDEIAEAAPENNPTIEEKPQVLAPAAKFSHPAVAKLTPNGDGQNDAFKVKGTHIKAFHIEIYHQFGGQMVFESNDIDFEWIGTDKAGSAVPAGQYMYRIQALGEDDELYKGQNAKGSIVLIR